MKQIGDEYFDSKEFRNILDSYEASVGTGHPIFMDVDDLADIADYYNMVGKKEKAIQTADLALDLNPGATLPLVFKARQALDAGDIETARRLAGQIISREDPEYTLIEAEIMIAEQRPQQADEYLTTYFENLPDEEKDDCVLDITALYLDYGEYKLADKWKKRARDRRRKDIRDMSGRVDFALGDFDKSLETFRQLVDEEPYNKRYWYACANNHFMKDELNETLDCVDFGIAIDPEDPDCLLLKANVLFKKNSYKEAVRYYERYLSEVPADASVKLNIGVCCINLQQYDLAIDYLHDALNLTGDDEFTRFSVLQEMAFAYSAMKMPGLAMACINEADKLPCDHADMKVLKGHIYLENNEPQKAQKMFQQAVAESDNSPRIVLRVILSLYDNEYFDICFKLLRHFLKTSGKDCDEGYAYMALCCWEMKKDSEFLTYLELIVKRNTDMARTVLGHLFPEGMQPADYHQYMYNKLNHNEK